MSGATAASTKVWRRLGGPARNALLRDLPGAELIAILLDISRVRASDLSDADLARHWREDPFLAPSTADPRELLRVELALWDLLPQTVVALDLSPLAPLGSVSRLSGIGQNRALVTARGSEMIFDPVQPLALEAARRRRSNSTPRRRSGAVACSQQRRAELRFAAHCTAKALVIHWISDENPAR